jgi:hypothetical protein
VAENDGEGIIFVSESSKAETIRLCFRQGSQLNRKRAKNYKNEEMSNYIVLARTICG